MNLQSCRYTTITQSPHPLKMTMFRVAIFLVVLMSLLSHTEGHTNHGHDHDDDGGDGEMGEVPAWCVDDDPDCSVFATRTPSECLVLPAYMWRSCKRSCNQCTLCKNNHTDCEERARMNPSECEKNTDYMQEYCPKACGFCGKPPPCVNVDSKCVTWAKEGKCETNPDEMYPKCIKACKKCTNEVACIDKHIYCTNFTELGHCESRPSYMMENCQRTCGVCGPRVGCFDMKDFPKPRSKKLKSKKEIQMTPYVCKRYCRNENFKYAGLKNGKDCYCGDAYDTMVNDYECQVPCDGDEMMTCGGKKKLEIYDVEYSPVC